VKRENKGEARQSFLLGKIGKKGLKIKIFGKKI
jgi:hypothetical protein